MTAGPFTNEYTALPMDRHITGLWTQRNLLRDADVAYLTGKYYGGSRYDSLLDGINREMTANLTSKRRPGTSIYINNTPPANSFYSYRHIVDGKLEITVLQDSINGEIYDITRYTLSKLIYTRTGPPFTPLNKARFASLNTQLFMCDGYNNIRFTYAAKTWKANTEFTVGDYIVDENGNIQSFQAQNTVMTIASIAVVAKTLTTGVTQNYLVVTFTAPVPVIGSNQVVEFAGIAHYVSLNGQLLTYRNIAPGWGLQLSPSQLAFATIDAVYPDTNDTGTGTAPVQFDANGDSLTGVTGATEPVWTLVHGDQKQDGTVTWTNYGSAIGEWGIAAPAAAPTLKPGPAMHWWYPSLDLTGVAVYSYAILDAQGSVQVMATNVAPATHKATGPAPPNWNTSIGGLTQDGDVQWVNVGDQTSWIASFGFPHYTSIHDTNGFIEFVSIAGSGPPLTGTTVPTWPTTPGTSTVDNNIVWINAGPGAVLVSGSYTYAISYHCIDGSVSTASPTEQEIYGALGPSGGFCNILQFYGTDNPQVDQIWIWRTAQGQSTLVFLDSVPNPGEVVLITYYDTIPDTFTPGTVGELIAQIIAPIAHQNDPPPKGMVAPCYYLGRMWGIVDNRVVYSGGPDTITGNGFTAWPPLNSFPLIGQPVKLRAITVQGGGLLVETSESIYIIVGSGTGNDPFLPPRNYMQGVGILGYDAEDMVGSTLYLYTSKRKFVSLDPSAGYIECGFPIGDQFTLLTQDGYDNTNMFDPAKTFVTWHEASSGDTAVYVGQDGLYFRYSPIASPESGFVWSPMGQITGSTSAMQSVEVEPGVSLLLFGNTNPVAGGITCRDRLVNTDTTWDNANDDHHTPYRSYEIIGNISLCETGQVAELAHVALKSVAVGARPLVGILFDELFATPEVPFDVISITGPEPPDLPQSETMYSDRYSLAQNGVCPKCETVQLKIDYGTQDAPDELLKHALYGMAITERPAQ